MRILVADDHAFARKGFRLFVSQIPGVTAVGEAASGVETLRRLRQDGPWQVLILDIDMPDRGGLDILRHVRASHPDLRVLVLSGYPEGQYAVQMLRAGAHGYVRKSASPDEIRAAVEAVGSGHRHISPELAQLLAERVAGEHTEVPALHKTLNEREFQVFCKVAMGRDVPQIARELCVSRKTVSTYRSKIMRKLAVQTQAQLIAYAMKSGVVQ